MKTIVAIIVIASITIPSFAQLAPKLPDDFLQQTRISIDPMISSKAQQFHGGEETLDSVIYWNWHEDHWDYSSKYIYHYNDKGLLSEGLQEVYDEDAWTPDNRILFTYDQQDNLVGHLFQMWDGPTWMNLGRIVSTFDDDGNELTILSQVWNGNDWDNDFLYTYTYGDFHNILTWETNNWTGMWVPWYRNTYTYNELQMTSHRLVEFWDGVTWTNDQQLFYHYNANGNLQSTVTKIWENDDWMDSNQIFYTYDSHNNVINYHYQIMRKEEDVE